MARQPDLSWEALVGECNASIPAERGRCNAALRLIRQAMGDVGDENVAQEIRNRARRYRLTWPDIPLTPTALAKHWERVVSERPEQGVNLHASANCPVCDGDHFLPRERDGREVMVPCPDCGPLLSDL